MTQLRERFGWSRRIEWTRKNLPRFAIAVPLVFKPGVVPGGRRGAIARAIRIQGQKGAGGRPRGARNKITLQIREAATKFFDDVYWRRLRSDLRKGKLNPQLEITLLAYAFGRPIDRLEVGRVGGFSKLSDEELIARFEEMARSLRAEPSTPTTG
jgi:hypothetical protein